MYYYSYDKIFPTLSLTHMKNRKSAKMTDVSTRNRQKVGQTKSQSQNIGQT